MKASELRVGNWVNNNGEDYQITSATISQLERNVLEESSAIPIKLTEEWIKLLGFKKIKNYKDEVEFIKTHNKPSKNIYLRFFGTDSTVFNHSECEPEQIQYISTVVYVHQLQNLYHALTGEELTIKQ